ncbi:AcrR family transcriptional regulator [Rhodococcus sp. LBL1]|uniref:AcrR family transcriptional regulator n=1 Tax=Prescottella agglutinans TaxID=1644129 RepID=A0ABT6M9R4_9NOCA|nr:TetR/AcrR family transcriptional regulator [Prescottella agglutinans]MDH6281048.1 AcrR family transcriptional regulator [Prescottella agglutinans]MDH6676311.1 AcrR family transcriptional regulator [Rhodococcus sp. LBL1]MDH6681597.1 AcrR family transcriptional regulator [Rhodococcus sp. LBL2]
MAYRRTPAVEARLAAQRDAIFEAAVAVLSEAGYQGLTIAAVANRAQVATGTVYSHFTGKSDLVVAVFREIVGREVAAVNAAAGPGRSAGERIAAVIETFGGRAMRNPKLAYTLLAEPVDAAVDAERLIFRRTFADAFAAAVAAGVAAGELAPQNVPLVAASLVGATAEVLAGPLASGQDAPGVIDDLVRFALTAVGAAPVKR